MLRTAKPRTAKGKRIQLAKEPQLIETTKQALFIRGTTTSQLVSSALKNLYQLKRPDGILFSKRNEVRPFEDPRPLEFFADKNDAAILVVASHSKKRPHNLVIARTFDNQVMDMVELGIEGGVSMEEFKGQKAAIGHRPLLLFHGDAFESHEDLRTVRSLFMDLYRGDATADLVNLSGLEHVISITAVGGTEGNKRIHMRVFTVHLKKSGTKLPRVELEEMGPSIDFVLRRYRLADKETWKMATKVPKQVKEKKEKNIEFDDIGDKFGRVHMGKQDLGKLQTRKMKGLKRAATDDEGDDAGEAVGSGKRQRAEDEE
ncbi:rRNA-binding ribosome biosynthesis protein rpf2 [Rhizophlyctis rosea]|uniref:Ribosome production factor 2 homolog n=1 Tax=Rhizophlyctis rosea TaxID=64517 RepID=A0AAD5S9Q2_9FUNG|nr:rRNA-binding ribosome biosynthesis protein rpf2 [Rhizophlyctis rosea]